MRAFPWPLIPAAAHTVAEQTHPGNGCLCTGKWVPVHGAFLRRGVTGQAHPGGRPTLFLQAVVLSTGVLFKNENASRMYIFYVPNISI